LTQIVIDPLYALAGTTIDVRAIRRGLLDPRTTVGEEVAARLSDALFGRATLQDLPNVPDIVVGATNLQTGGFWRFSKSGSGNLGTALARLRVPLATVTAASCAYPPLLPPVKVPLDPARISPDRSVILIDGGAIDNLAFDYVWETCDTVLVSDALRGVPSRSRVSRNPALAFARSREISEKELRRLRIASLRDALERGVRQGAYWGIDDAGSEFDASMQETTPDMIETRLARLDETVRRTVANWGYVATDVGLRRWFDRTLPTSQALPFMAGAR